MSSDVDTTKTVVVTAALDSNRYLVVTIQGGGDVAILESLNMTVNGKDEVMLNKTDGSVTQWGKNLSVGASFNSTRPINSGDHVVVVAYFRDGSQQVVLEKFY